MFSLFAVHWQRIRSTVKASCFTNSLVKNSVQKVSSQLEVGGIKEYRIIIDTTKNSPELEARVIKFCKNERN